MRSFIQSYLGDKVRGFARDEGGAAIVLIAAASIVLVGAAGLAFDSGRGYLIQARLSQAVDAAALAGGRSLSIGGGGDYKQQIEKYLKANLPDTYMGVKIDPPQIKLSGDGDQVTVSASATIPTTLMRVMHVDDLRVSASSTVNREVKGLEVALVLDNSTSMRGSKLSDLKTSANLLLDILYGDNETVEDLHVSIVPFSGRSNLVGATSVHPESPVDPDYVCLDTRPAPHNTDDATPTDSPFDHFSGGYAPPSRNYKRWVCPEAGVLPLEQAKTTVEDALEDMAARGCTRYDIGAVWGWRNLSEDWRGVWGSSDLPMDYDESTMDKAIIIMTDGANTPWCVGDPEDQSQTETMFSTICSDMKAKGIIVYTITFKLEDEATNDLFEACASGSERYFKSPNGDELESAFTIIANDLSTLRLTN